MSSGTSDSTNALVKAVRYLPARTELVTRGIALAQRLLVDLDELISTSMQNAHNAWSTASALANADLSDGPLREGFREAALSACYWGLNAAEAMFMNRHPKIRSTEPFDARAVIGRAQHARGGSMEDLRHADPTSWTSGDVAAMASEDLFDQAIAANFLWKEGGLVRVDIGRYLIGLQVGNFDPDHVYKDVGKFLNDVADLYENGSVLGRLFKLVKAEELLAALEWPHFIENIHDVFKAFEVEAEKAHRTGTDPTAALEEAYRKVVRPSS